MVNRSSSMAGLVSLPDAALDALVLELATGALERQTPIELKRRIEQSYRSMERGRVAAAIKRLVEKKSLVYTYQFGNSFLEPSFDKPVRVANSIVVKPPACDYDSLPGDIVIDIKAGAAFGTGCHPTTRLSLMGLENVFKNCLPGIKVKGKWALDIGTGSGVLALAAMKLGLERGIGLDIDPCARAEATENAELNGLSKQIEISDRSLDSLKGRFLIITANLRLPTLTAYFDKMAALMENDGCLVISGIKSHEIKSLIRVSDDHEMQVFWEGKELGWGALVLRRSEER